MPNLLFIIITVSVVLLLVIWVVKVQNKLVSIDELCGNAMSQIGVQQNSRWDVLIALAKQTKQYSEHEYKTLMDVVAGRQGVNAHTNAGIADGQSDLLSQIGTRLMAVAEAYPELKSEQLYQQTMSGVKQYEENVRYSRMIYNDTVTKFNRIVRSFPASLLAGIMGFKIREYLTADENKKQMPDLN